MKTLMLTILAFTATSGLAFADTAAEMKKVKALADRKISGSDVKKEISSFENTDGNPCAAEGRTYVVTVSLRKSKMEDRGDEEVGQSRAWEEFNVYYVSQAALLKGADLSDTLCQE
ncbi:MAG: hypothetical protein EOP11_07795 [Proteobacteria bacterium]|nr:MAG: hypothetical protein EOP11_07795 [Pseudomonadota bacterium]